MPMTEKSRLPELGIPGDLAALHAALRIARVLFTVVAGEAVLLHGFIKRSRKTPQPDLKIARKRKALLK